MTDGIPRTARTALVLSALAAPALCQDTADLPALRARGFVRVLTVHDRTSFFVDGGVERGFEVEQMRAWMKEVNESNAEGQAETRLEFVPVTLEQLLPSLLAGRGDIVAANLTVTDERARQVTFAEPYLTDVHEIVVRSRWAAPLSKLKDLAGRRVHVTRTSSYAESLRALSDRLVADGAAPIEVVEVDARMQIVDLLELVNAGVVELTICDEHLARLWSGLFPDIVVHEDLSVSPEREIAWGVRPTNPLLLASLSAFAVESGGDAVRESALFERYFGDPNWIRSPLEPETLARFEALAELFQRQTEGTGFDWLQIAAQAFQESGLDQEVKSPSGAVGLMQLSAERAKETGCLDRTEPNQNVAAGVKYMVWLRDNAFAEDEPEPGTLFDFCLAAYNAGPELVDEWRKQAGKVGLNPNRWFGNVEHLALEPIGRETVRYVGNVNKYEFAYRTHAEKAVASEGR